MKTIYVTITLMLLSTLARALSSHGRPRGASHMSVDDVVEGHEIAVLPI